MKGYKVTDKDMRCLEFQYEMDKEFIHNGQIILCVDGFHFCTNMCDCFKYYYEIGTRLFEVECEDVSDDVEIGCSKRVCGRIKFVKEINIDEQDEDFYLNMVKGMGDAIQLIKNPSCEVQLAAVNQNAYAIEYIKNPSLEVQLAAVSKNGLAIKYIKNPSVEVQMAAVNENGCAIMWINNPSREVQIVAVMQNSYALQWIKNPSPELQLVAVMQNKWAIQWIDYPSREVINYTNYVNSVK